MVKFPCSCGKVLTAPDERAGHRARCPKCQTVLTIPKPEEAHARSAAARQAQTPQHAVPHGQDELDVSAKPPQAAEPETDGPATVTVKYCPYCGEEIAVSAVKCKHCGEFLRTTTPPPPAAHQPYYPHAMHRPQSSGNASAVCGIISCVCGVVAFLFFPPLFGLAGLVLAIVALALSRGKGGNVVLGIIGLLLSIVGAVVGIFLGLMVMDMMRQ